MILQNIVLPESSSKEIRELYYHADSKVEQQDDGSIQISDGTKISFDTYFNLFSGKVWRKYTLVNQCVFQIKLQGKGIVFLKNENGFVVAEKKFHSKDNSQIENIELLLKQIELVCYYLEIYTEEPVRLFSADIMTNLTGREVHLALVTCTYNRKEALTRNLELLKRKNKVQIEKDFVLDNIYVVDNARNLNPAEIESDRIVLISNQNTGGAGGFARGLQEAIKNGVITHILLMDDDVQIEFEAMVRTKSILRYIKKEYEENFIGGAMFRTDIPYLLHAAGEDWNSGNIINPYKNMDMRTLKSVQKVIQPEGTIERTLRQLYSGWWYCCIPRKHIEQKGYPMPFFLHVDDVEYGLRSGKPPIYLNGIAVWHEEFENKRSSVMEYYDVRNRLITNCIYLKGKKRWNAIRILLERFASNVLRYRYKDVELVLLAVEDFLKGPEWLKHLNSGEYHRNLSNYGYQMHHIKKVKVNVSNKSRSKIGVIIRYLFPAYRSSILQVGALVEEYAGKKEILLVDTKEQKGMKVRKSWKETFYYAGKIIVEGIVLLFRYGTMEQAWLQEVKKIEESKE